MIAAFHRADLSDAVAVRPTAGGLDVDNDIVLPWIETEIDSGNVSLDAGIAKLAQARQLVAPDDVAFGRDF
jgi:hypothetical protein